MRLFSSEADIAAGQPRPRYLRSIPLNDPDFARLYGLREYQMHQMVVALMASKIRTGGDVSEFLGRWEPPERARRRNDA